MLHGWVPLCSGASRRFLRYLSEAKEGDGFEIRDSDTYQKTHTGGRLYAIFHHCFVFPLYCSVEIGFSSTPPQCFIFWFIDFLIISFLIFTLGFHCCLFWVCKLGQVSVDFKVLLFNISVWSSEITSKSCFGSAHQILICLRLFICLKQDRKIESYEGMGRERNLSLWSMIEASASWGSRAPTQLTFAVQTA